jgi:carboxylesterase type B
MNGRISAIRRCLAVPGISSGDAHTAELAYVFGHDGAGSPLPAGPNQFLSDRMITALGLFARAASVERLWDEGSPATEVVELTTPIHGSADFSSQHQCSFWQRLGVQPTLINHVD